jgi:hypothetical protein
VNWRKVQEVDAEAFRKEMTLPLVQDTLKHMQSDALEDRVSLMAAMWHAECDEQAWLLIVKPEISKPEFIRQLSHKQLLKLQDCSQVPDSMTTGMSRVLGLLPAKVITAAAERDAAADKTKKVACYRCRMLMTPWLVDNDPAGCTLTGPVNISPLNYDKLAERIVDHQPKHHVPADQFNEQPQPAALGSTRRHPAFR